MRQFQSRILSKVALVVTCVFLCGGWLSSGISKGKGKGGKGGHHHEGGGSNPQANGEGAGNGNGNTNVPSSPTAENLAAIIAGDAGGDSDQYRIYAVNLARTLAQLTPEQRARVFSE